MHYPAVVSKTFLYFQKYIIWSFPKQKNLDNMRDKAAG
jgi:hypothetical protein